MIVVIGWPFAYLIWKSPSMMDYHHICSSCDEKLSTFNPRKAKKAEKKQVNGSRVNNNMSGYKSLDSADSGVKLPKAYSQT